jgi:dCTP deaminase
MTVVNRSYLLHAAPIVDMHGKKLTGPGGTSYGLGEAGYDLRIAQTIHFKPRPEMCIDVEAPDGTLLDAQFGRFTLASAMEEFRMPTNLLGIVHDKSTWARRGLSVFNTVIECGWKGFLTLELVYHGQDELIIPAGSGIAQVVFHEVKEDAEYRGKYNNQPNRPVGPIASE